MSEGQGHNAEGVNADPNSSSENGNRSLPSRGHGNGSRPPSKNGATLDAHAMHALPSDVRSFETLFRTYHLQLCAFARSYVKRHEVAEELVEDVFLRLWELRGSWPDSANQKRYLYTAVRNQALKHLAHESVVRRVHTEAQENGRVPGMSEPSGTVEDEVQATELAAALRCAVDQLPARCREAYTLYREYGMTYAEVADVMGISVRTVETQLARAHKALQRYLAAWVSYSVMWAALMASLF